MPADYVGAHRAILLIIKERNGNNLVMVLNKQVMLPGIKLFPS